MAPSPRSILKRAASTGTGGSIAGNEALPAFHAEVHFPPSPSLTRTFSTHSSSVYDRSPIIIPDAYYDLDSRTHKSRTHKSISNAAPRIHLHPLALAALAQAKEDPIPISRQSEDNVILTVRDIDGDLFSVSRPVEYCRSWQSFSKYLITRQDLKAVTYLRAGKQFVLRRDDTGILSRGTWEAWISSFGYRSNVDLAFALCIVRDSEQCCDKPAENASGVCNNCETSYVDEDPSPLLESAPETSSDDTMAALMLAEPSVPTAAASNETSASVEIGSSQMAPVAIPDRRASTSVNPQHQAFNSQINTAPPLAAHNSVSMRRRRIPQAQDHSSSSPDSEHRSNRLPPLEKDTPDPLPDFGRSDNVDGSMIRRYLCAAYTVIVAPPFVHDEDTLWDEARLENRLNTLQAVVSVANFALLAVDVALLALTSIANNAICQTFVILSSIFALFGCFYATSMALHIGDRRKQFLKWFLSRANQIPEYPTFWNRSIMMSLPTTWLYWAFISLVSSMVTLLIQMSIYSVQNLSSSYSAIQVPATNTTDSTTPPSGPTNRIATGFNIFQLAVFWVMLTLSSVYVFMIHIEIWKCRTLQRGYDIP